MSTLWKSVDRASGLAFILDYNRLPQNTGDITQYEYAGVEKNGIIRHVCG
jgi:hypothetical protein